MQVIKNVPNDVDPCVFLSAHDPTPHDTAITLSGRPPRNSLSGQNQISNLLCSIDVVVTQL